MTKLIIDLSDALDEFHPDDKVVVWSPVHREGARGQVVNTAQKQIKLDGGNASQEVEPGPLMVKIQCRGLSDTAPKEVTVPDQAEVSLWDLLEQDFTYTPPIISEVVEARAEVREAVARVGSAEQVGEWAERSETAASDALTIKNSIPATVQSEVDTRVPPKVAEVIAADSTVVDAAAAAVGAAAEDIVAWRGDLPDDAVVDDMRLEEHRGAWALSTPQAASHAMPSDGFGMLTVLWIKGIPGYANAIQVWESAYRNDRWTRTRYRDGEWSDWVRSATLADVESMTNTAKSYTDSAIEEALAGGEVGGGGGAAPADPYEPVAVGMKNRDLLDQLIARKGGTIGTGGRAAFALRLDHGTNAFRDELGPILKKYGLPATMAVYSEQREVNPDNNSVDWEEVESWHHSHGMSYGNHSDDHLDKPGAEGWYGGTIGSHQALRQLMPKVPIEQYLPHGSVGYERYGGFNKASSHELIVGTLAGRMALSTHALISGYRGGRYRNLTGRPMHGLTHWSMEESDPAAFRSVIDTAIDTGRGVAVMFHPEFIGKNRKMNWAQIDECMAYVAQKRDEGVLAPLTLDGLAVADYRSDYRDDLLAEDLALMRNGAQIYGNFTETPGAFTSSTPESYVRHLASTGNTPELRGGIRTAEWHISSTSGGAAHLSVTEAIDAPTWGSQRTVEFGPGESVLYLPFGIPLDAGSMRIELTLLSGDITIHETHAYAS